MCWRFNFVYVAQAIINVFENIFFGNVEYLKIPIWNSHFSFKQNSLIKHRHMLTHTLLKHLIKDLCHYWTFNLMDIKFKWPSKKVNNTFFGGIIICLYFFEQIWSLAKLLSHLVIKGAYWCILMYTIMYSIVKHTFIFKCWQSFNTLGYLSSKSIVIALRKFNSTQDWFWFCMKYKTWKLNKLMNERSFN